MVLLIMLIFMEWLHYKLVDTIHNMEQLLRKFIKAERLGNWYLHLKAVSEKLSQLAVLLCAEVKRAVHDMSVAKYSIGEQNKEMTKARQHRDMKDTHTLLLFLSAHLSGTS